MGRRPSLLTVVTAIPSFVALLAAAGLQIAHSRLENQQQAYLRAWEAELRAAEAKRPDPDGRDHKRYIEASLAVERECGHLYAERAFTTDNYAADQSLLLGFSWCCLIVASLCLAVYGYIWRWLIRDSARVEPCAVPDSVV
jgi:hypothetical protein